MRSCPKCGEKYTHKNRRFKTKHHILPQRLWRNRVMPEHLKEMLDGNTFDICRTCHDELNDVIEAAEREVLYIEHQRMYADILIEFLKKGGGHATISLEGSSNGNGLLSAKAIS